MGAFAFFALTIAPLRLSVRGSPIGSPIIDVLIMQTAPCYVSYIPALDRMCRGHVGLNPVSSPGINGLKNSRSPYRILEI
jgi:hypothetical protein